MKRALKYAIPVAAIVAQGIDEPADATDLFLKLDGIDGESTGQNHEDEIDILAWSWSVLNSIDITDIGGGGGAGKSAFTPLKVIKSVDAATADLIARAALGTQIPTATLTATRPTPKGPVEEFMRVTLDSVYVTKVSHGGKDTEDGVAETVTLDYGRVKLEYRPFDVNKGSFGPWEETCFDRIKGVSC